MGAVAGEGSIRLVAMILGAGKGTRLRPLTDWVAKPMVPIGDAPAVAHVLARVRRASVDSVVVNIHHRPDDLRAWAEREGVAVSEERELLGTAGGLARAGATLGAGEVLVWNGDILVEIDSAGLHATHQRSRAIATLAVVPRAKGEGTVGLGPSGEVVRLRGERHGEERRSADFVGVHIVSEALRARLPSIGCLVADVYLPALREGLRISHHMVEDDFIDVGTLESYVAANRAWLRCSAASSADSSWFDPSARVAPSVRVRASIVGAGARVSADVTRSIVWPGARVDAPVADAIVTPFGQVPIPA